MPLIPGSRLGPYEILSPIGAGGMGEVYRARDTRIDRTVAIKILPANFARDPASRERFDREARAISQVEHPHICALYDVGEDAGTHFLVMQYLEGETLADRLKKGPLPLDRVLRHAIEIAGALDAAHRRGIVHRDLKPGNVMLTKAGATLLDFGLAKQAVAGMADGATGLPTRSELTAQGTILGTLQYMAPEQLEGREADARTDIFAFGAVVYEMATGHKAFEGTSQASIIAAILDREPKPMSSLQTMTPAALESLVTRCLAKDPGERWQSAADVAHQLRWIAEAGPSAATITGVRPARRPWPWIVATAVCFLAAVALAVVYFQEARPAERVLRYTIPLPKDGQAEGLYFHFHVSPDGRWVAASGVVGDQSRGIFVRELDSWNWRLLPGTDTGDFFWSPDSRSIGFFDTGKLKKVPVTGGPPEDVSDVPGGYLGFYGSGSWGTGNVIVFSSLQARGGVPRPATTTPADGANHMFPAFLPDGRHFLYTSRGGSNPGVYVASLDNPAGVRLLADESSAHFAPAASGDPYARVLFVRNGTLMAQRFDPSALALEGDAFVVAERVLYSDNGAAAVSASDNGVLLLLDGRSRESDSRLAWFDRSGTMVAAEGSLGPPSPTSLSPDERAVAVLRRQPGAPVGDIWLRTPSRDVGETRFTFDNAIASNANMVWSPDGNRVAFSSSRDETIDLYVKELRGSEPGGTPVLQNANRKFVTDWSRDGWLAYTEIDPKTGADLWYLRMLGDKAAGAPVAFLQTEFDESFGQISPDGRWMAYLSIESGTNEVYVRPFPSGAGKWKTSTPFGTTQATGPRWSRDGKRLLYLTGPAGKYTLMEAPVTLAQPAASGTAARFETGASKPLFEVRVNAFHPGSGTFFYSVSNDGRRFLINHVDAASEPVLNLVVNWQEAFGGR